MSQIQQLRKGSTPLLLLTVLADGRMYGYQIMRELERRSEGYFTMTAALLYPALHELEQQDLVVSEWEENEGQRKRKFYTITDQGRQALGEHRSEWRRFLDHIHRMLQSTEGNPQEE